MLLRKHMEGCKINAVAQPNFERILEIKFDSYNELGERTPMILSCEFMGKHSNIILYSYETNVIQGCAHPVSHEKSRERELAGGLPYIYLPKQAKYDLTQISKEKFFELAKIMDAPVNVWLNEKFGFISKALATEFCNFLEIDIEKNKISAVSQQKISYLYELIIDTINFENIHKKLLGFSGAEIQSVCTEAGYFAIRENRSSVTEKDFQDAIIKLIKKEAAENEVSMMFG